jgi:excisionase family DNA binding protein
MQETVPQLLDLAAVAQRLCLSKHTIRAMVRAGRLRPIRLCRRLLFHPDEIARFLVDSGNERPQSEAAATPVPSRVR